ncbi:SRPBCC domain-containing protein [Arthrobacter sp. Bz4]|uniref:SRPBCC family protein n=1 Tax=Arthrobacter sp. Bz4 TaxID=2171979 RepID=UPI000D50BFAA|nr:SRPBCC domain-containing protein [Arthrobacter sp. Bz4]PVE20055.1 polyketide cyclase [Arthrobacter sp. Bz4]
MTVISTHKDTEALTLTIVAEFSASVERLWQVWEDPRQLERWWGPPTYPATFDSHDFVPGGKASYYMTGPEGDKSRGWWEFTAINAPTHLEFDDGFADENGDPMDEMGTTHSVVTLEAIDSGTRMTTVSSFESLEQLEKMIAMGMEEGIKQAMGQIDAVLERTVV